MASRGQLTAVKITGACVRVGIRVKVRVRVRVRDRVRVKG
jgi:hypothetical protein